MTLDEVPRVARAASWLALLAGAAGALLIVAAVVDLHWWSTPEAHRLAALITEIRLDRGTRPPALLRDGAGAIYLLVLGICCLTFLFLVRPLRNGHFRARTAAVVLGVITFIFGLIGIGIDAAQPVDLAAYLQTLSTNGVADRVPQVQALVYPGGYLWLEDIAQGLQALTSIATALTIIAVGIWYPEHYTRGGRVSTEPDAWGDAITRIRDQNKTD